MNHDKIIQYLRQGITAIGLKLVIKPVYNKLVIGPLKKQRVKRFQKAALPVLIRFNQVMTENGFKYSLIFGSLLGAIREKGFLKHDDDIDVAMWNSQWSPKLRKASESAGFKLVHTFIVDDGKSGREETYVYNNIQIDIFFFYEAIDTYPYTCIFNYWPNTSSHSICMSKYGGSLVIRYQMPFSTDFHYVPFESIELPIPENAKEVLACTYGEDFMIPKPNWVGGSYKKYRTDWDGKIGVYNEY